MATEHVAGKVELTREHVFARRTEASEEREHGELSRPETEVPAEPRVDEAT